MEICKKCCNRFDSGIWISSQFKDEKLLLFCSEKCKSVYFNIKIRRIKEEYTKYYEKLAKDGKEKIIENFLKDKNKQ